MISSIHFFIRQFLGVVLLALLPVVLVAFWTIPYNLGAHPGEPRAVDIPVPVHMT